MVWLSFEVVKDFCIRFLLNVTKEKEIFMAVKVMIACGSGIATSAYAAEEIQKIAKGIGVDIDVHKERIQNVMANAADYDICFVTSNFKQDVGTKLVRVDGLISGINEDAVIEDVKAALLEAAAKYNAD